MDLEDYRTIFVATSLVLLLVALLPVIDLVISFPMEEDSFSEFWLLDSSRKTDAYPFVVGIGEENTVFVDVSNNLGYSAYYRVYVKFCNHTQFLPSVAESKPSPLPSLFEFHFFVEDGGRWEAPLSFQIPNASVQGDVMLVDAVSINGTARAVGSSSTWDAENEGFYFYLLLELWVYDPSSQRFMYHDRFVGVWLNVTQF